MKVTESAPIPRTHAIKQLFGLLSPGTRR